MELTIIEPPLVVEILCSIAAFFILYKMATMGDAQIEDCGWLGHQSSDEPVNVS